MLKELHSDLLGLLRYLGKLKQLLQNYLIRPIPTYVLPAPTPCFILIAFNSGKLV